MDRIHNDCNPRAIRRAKSNSKYGLFLLPLNLKLIFSAILMSALYALGLHNYSPKSGNVLIAFGNIVAVYTSRYILIYIRPYFTIRFPFLKKIFFEESRIMLFVALIYLALTSLTLACGYPHVAEQFSTIAFFSMAIATVNIFSYIRIGM